MIILILSFLFSNGMMMVMNGMMKGAKLMARAITDRLLSIEEK